MSRPAKISARTTAVIHGDQLEITQVDPFDSDLSQSITVSKDSAERLLPILQRFIREWPAAGNGTKKGPPVRKTAGPGREETPQTGRSPHATRAAGKNQGQ